RSNRKMLVEPPPAVCPATRSVAPLTKITQWPSSETAGRIDVELPAVVEEAAEWLTRVVVPAVRSRRKTSVPPLVSTCPATRFTAVLVKATPAVAAHRRGGVAGEE